VRYRETAKQRHDELFDSLRRCMMKRLSIVVGSIVVAVFASGAIAAEEVQEAPLTWKQAALSDGADLYAELCAVCHGADGKGAGPAAVALKEPVPDLTLLAKYNEGEFPGEDVEKAITGEAGIPSHGTLDMPIWGRAFADSRLDLKPFRREALAKQRIFNLTAHLESIQAK
jgi:mono/diheme cytochrome c family protein